MNLRELASYSTEKQQKQRRLLIASHVEIVRQTNPEILKERVLKRAGKENLNVPIIEKSIAFAEEIHKEEKRKFSDNPYSNHSLQVALISIDLMDKITTDKVAGDITHDVLENCKPENLREIRKDLGQIGTNVLRRVEILSNIQNFSHGERKKFGEKKQYYVQIYDADQTSPEQEYTTSKTADRVANLLDPFIKLEKSASGKTVFDLKKQAYEHRQATIQDTKTLFMPYALPHRPDLASILSETINQAHKTCFSDFDPDKWQEEYL